MTSTATTPDAREVILDGANVASYLQDRLRFSTERIATMLARGQVFVASQRAEKLAKDAAVLADLQGALNRAMDTRSRLTAAISAAAKDLPSRVHMRRVDAEDALNDLVAALNATQAHFGMLTHQNRG